LLKIRLRASEQMLLQTFVSLLFNAVKFTAEGATMSAFARWSRERG